MIRIFLVLFDNGHFHNVCLDMDQRCEMCDVEKKNVVSTLSNVVHINVEIHNVDLKLFDVVNSNVETHNVVSTLI